MFHVIWKPTAEEQLAALCLDPSPGGSEWIAQVVDFFEHRVALRPLEQGESRSGATRIVIFERLAFTYDVILDDRRVEVLDVRSM